MRVGEEYVAELDVIERRVLAAVVADTAELLGARLQDGVQAGGARATADSGADPLDALRWREPDSPGVPDDPALARLLPSASRDDEELAAEFRRLTEQDLRETKTANLRLVWTGLRGRAGLLRIRTADAPRWAAALSDVRLVLANRLGIEDDDAAEEVYAVAMRDDAPTTDGGSDEVRAAMATLYAALTWLQESLVDALLADGPA